MATAKRESMAKTILDQRHPRKTGARKPNHSLRGHRHLVTLSEEELSRREQGWNDRFTVDPPRKSNKVPSAAHSPTFSTPPTPRTKESRIWNERAQYGKRGKRNRESKKPSSGKLMPLGTLSQPPSEAAQPTKEEKLRFKVLKVIDARETFLYQLSALILCTPVQEPLFLPSRPTEPPTTTSAGRQMRSRGGMILASGPMTNAREATKLAQQLATDLQVTGIQCVEALVEWMLEAGAHAETPPPFLWRGRNYFLKMFSDLDFAEAELQARGVNLDCFKQHNPLLIKPNQKLGRILAADSIIREMVEFAKDMTPMELLALSGRMRDSNSRDEIQPNDKEIIAHSSSSGWGTMNEAIDPVAQTDKLWLRKENVVDKLEPRDQQSAVDLVNLLDESLEFIRTPASREGEVNQTEATIEHEYEDDYEANNNYTSEEEPDGGLSGKNVTEDDKSEGKLEPELSDRPNSRVQELNGEADIPQNNQSEYEDTFGDRDNSGDKDVETFAPQSLSDLRQDRGKATVDADAELPNNKNFLGDEGVPKMVDVVPTDVQHSSRSNRSENQSEYDNSFDVDTGGDDETGKSEVIAAVQQRGETDAPCRDEDTEPCKLVDAQNSDRDEARKVANDLPAISFENPISSRTEDTNGTEYENSFDDDVDEGEHKNGVIDNAVTISATVVTTAAPTTFNNVPPIVGMEVGQWLVGNEEDQPVDDTGDSQTVSKRLEHELKRWTFLNDENHPNKVNAQGCLGWCSSRTLMNTLHERSSLTECMEGSIISMLEQYGLAVPESPLESLLCSDIAKELDLASHLLDECQAVLDDSCSVIAEAIQGSLGQKNSLVSEIEIAEVLEITEAVRQEYHASTFDFLKIATALLIFLPNSDKFPLEQMKSRIAVSAGFSRLVKVFYPYLVVQPREELSDNWSPVNSVLGAMGLPVDRLYFSLDPMCKILLLAVRLCSHQDPKDEDGLAVFPKVNVVCDRNDVLRSSMEYVWRHYLSSEKEMSNFTLYPFFKSSFGEKIVDGMKVEEGEGKGPLKEWFTMIGMQLASKWKQVPTNNIISDADSTQVTVRGNTISILGAAESIHPGFQLEWETSNGETIIRVVNMCVENGKFLLDRSVPTSHSFVASQLRIYQPSSAIFEYIQGSECYWLNENLNDSPDTRNLLTFVGWFLASAILHFSSIQLRIHSLFFRLLLNPKHCVTLEEVQLFNPQLFESLSRMKDMNPSDFAEYLKFEGADARLSVDEYINYVLKEKFGATSAIGWQLHSVRQGFTRIITLDQLSRVSITEVDLVESICGSRIGSGEDFAVNEIFRIAADKDFSSCWPLMNAFWQTVNAFDPQLKRKFIKFVTGVDTLPVPGTEFLRIEMPFTAISSNDHVKCLQMLPQAHTCDNTLELPHYWKALCWREQHDEHEGSTKLEEELLLVLSKKLRDAVEYSSGYGLDSTSAIAGVLAEKPLVPDAKEESYDSMGIPALIEDQGAAELDNPHEIAPRSPQTSEHEADQDDDAVLAPVETNPESSAAVVSPRPEESYEEYDWEEESVS